MSWLNLNQSLTSLKGQITNFASEVLAEGADPAEGSDESHTELEAANIKLQELTEQCRSQDLEISALKKLNDDLQTTLQTERISRKNGFTSREEDGSWFWDPPAQPPQEQIQETVHPGSGNSYGMQMQALQEEISDLKAKLNEKSQSTQDGNEKDKEELKRLREENKNITASLEDLDNQHQMAMERLLDLKKQLQKNFEILRQEHDDLKSTNDQYSKEVEQLKLKLAKKDNEASQVIKTSKADYETLHHKYINLERIHSILQESTEKFQEENQELHEEIFKLQEELTKYEHDEDIKAKHAKITDMIPREKYEELLKELVQLQDNRRSTDLLHLDETNIDDNAKSVIEKLKHDIADLKHKLSPKNDSDVSGSSSAGVVNIDQLIKMYNQYVHFDLPVDCVSESPLTGEGILICKVESAFKTLNKFKNEIEALEHKLSEKTFTENQLQGQIDDLTSDNDFLTADLGQCERDLSEMKKNNDYLLSEITTLKNASKLEPIIESHEDNIVKLESELADCNKINRSFKNEIRAIENELSAVKDEKIRLQTDLNDLRNIYSQMMIELDTYRSNSADVLEITSQINQNEKLRKEIHELKRKLAATALKNEQLGIDHSIVENEKVLLTSQIDELKHNLEDKNNTYKELNARNVILEHELHDTEQRVTELAKLKDNAEKDLQTLVDKLKRLATQTDSEEQIKEFLDSLKTIKREAELYAENYISKVLLRLLPYSKTKTSHISALDTFKTNDEVVQLSKENGALLEKIELKNIDLQTYKNRNELLMTEVVNLKSNLSSESSNVSQLEDVIANLKLKLANLETCETEIDGLRQDKQSLLEMKAQVEKDLEISVKQVVTAENRVAKLLSDIEAKEIEIKRLRETSNADKLNEIDSLKDDIKVKDENINRLNNIIQELKKEIASFDANRSQRTEYYEQIAQAAKELNEEVEVYKNNLTVKETELTNTKAQLEAVHKALTENAASLETLTAEKAELIHFITLKHNENIKYHNEIQRLNQIIVQHTNDYKNVSVERDALKYQSENCMECEKLRVILQVKDATLQEIHEKGIGTDMSKQELANARDLIRNLTEKCEELDKNLTIQLDATKRLTAEKVQLSEREASLSKELERLRRHLAESEEAHTQELLASEQKLNEYRGKLASIEERAKQTGTVYTSNSIRTQQEVETLRTQIRLLERQREEAQALLGEAEDRQHKGLASLANLQLALEQFQSEKERDIATATEKLRNRAEDMSRANEQLKQEVRSLNGKLEESMAGLKAAARLGDQLETKSAQLADYRDQVRTLQETLRASEERYRTACGQQERVDKGLVKNLLLNYLQAADRSGADRVQVLRILSTVLDFNQLECERVGLAKAATAAAGGADSLAREFVKFLEKESRPSELPNMMGLTQSAAPAAPSPTPHSRKNSGLGPQPTPLEVLGHARTASAGSGNLLLHNVDSFDSGSRGAAAAGLLQPRDTEGAILKHVLRDA